MNSTPLLFSQIQKKGRVLALPGIVLETSLPFSSGLELSPLPTTQVGMLNICTLISLSWLWDFEAEHFPLL